MSTRPTLLHTQDVRPRSWELLAFAVSLLLLAVSAVTLRVQPDYLLTVASSTPGRGVVAVNAGVVDLRAGDVVVIASPEAGSGALGANGTVVTMSGEVATIRLDRPVDVHPGDAVVVRAQARPALAALVGRILR